MTQWGLDTLFNPAKRHMDEEKQRLQSTREEIGDSSGGKRIDLESGKVTISRGATKDDAEATDETETTETADRAETSDQVEAETSDQVEAETSDQVEAETTAEAETADQAEATDTVAAAESPGSAGAGDQ